MSVDTRRRRHREITGPSKEEMECGEVPNYIVGGIFPAAVASIGFIAAVAAIDDEDDEDGADDESGGFFPDVPGDRSHVWGPEGNNRYPGLYGWRQDAVPALVSGFAGNKARLVNQIVLGNPDKKGAFGFSPRGYQNHGTGSFKRDTGAKGKFLDDYGALVGAVNSVGGGSADEVGRASRRQFGGARAGYMARGGEGAWTDKGFNPSGYRYAGMGNFRHREGYRGQYADSYSNLVSGGADEVGISLPGITLACAAMKRWVGEQGGSIVSAYVAEASRDGKTIAARGYIIRGLSRAAIEEQAQSIAKMARTYYKILRSGDGIALEEGDIAVIFCDDCKAVPIAAPSASGVGQPTICVDVGAFPAVGAMVNDDLIDGLAAAIDGVDFASGICWGSL